MTGHADQRAAGERGQATVEVALVLPVVVLLALAVLQVGVLVREQLLVTAAAREAVRAAAVSTDPAAADRAVGSTGGLRQDRLQVRVSRDPDPGGTVHVHLTYTAGTEVPMIGALLPDVTLGARAAMRSET